MAYDKVVDSSVLDGYFGDIADAIRAKTGDTATMTPADMPVEIADIQSGMDPAFEALISGMASGDIDVTFPEYTQALTIAFGNDSSYYKRNNYDVTGLTIRGARFFGNNSLTAPGNGGLYLSANADKLKYIRLPDCEELVVNKANLYTNAFQNLEEFTAPNILQIYGNRYLFKGYNPTPLKQFICPKFQSDIQIAMFEGCTALTIVDICSMTIANAFQNCSSLVAVVLRASPTITTLSASNAFAATPIASGTGYFYVPRDLISTYEAATNWTTFAGQFRALEDYTDDGTITGEFIMPAA